MPHLLVTNDFPPKIGGIQSYLWELWRRLPPEEVTVLTSSYEGDTKFDAEQPFRIERAGRVLLPTPRLRRRIRTLAKEVNASIVVIDPALPLGALGPSLKRPYAVLLHGAEVTVPARLPGASRILRRTLAGATHIIAGGGYPAEEARRLLGPHTPPVTIVPPGVDTDRFVPLSGFGKAKARAEFGATDDSLLVVCVSRLVPRKGIDTLISAAAIFGKSHPELEVLIAGTGRDASRLQRLIDREKAPVRLLGRVSDEDLPDLYGCADIFAMLCRNRWAGLEQEGFGIVFAEANSCGVAAIAGDSGGAAEAVLDGVTGIVVRQPSNPLSVVSALEALGEEAVRSDFGSRGRQRVLDELGYDLLASRLADCLEEFDK